jgi:hypothetical protein
MISKALRVLACPVSGATSNTCQAWTNFTSKTGATSLQRTAAADRRTAIGHDPIEKFIRTSPGLYRFLVELHPMLDDHGGRKGIASH